MTYARSSSSSASDFFITCSSAPCRRDSWNHVAFEKLIGDRRGDAAQELSTHLRVFMQHAQEAFFLLRSPPRRALTPFSRELLAR
jgi:hypothetical protein